METVRARLLAAFLLLSPLPLAGLAYLYVKAFDRTLNVTVLSSLSSMADKKADQIDAYVGERITDNQALAKSFIVARALVIFSRLLYEEGIASARYRSEDRRFRSYFQNILVGDSRPYDLLIIDLQGDVVFSMQHEPDLGTNLNSGPYRNSGLALAHREALAMLATQMSAAAPYLPSGGKPAIFLVTPVVQAGKPIGTVALQLDLAKLTAVIADTTGLGDTGETVVAQNVEGEALFISPLRHIPGAEFRRRLTVDGLADPMRAAFTGGYGAGRARDYVGVDVVAAWRYLPSLRCGMVVKIDSAEALGLARRLRIEAVGALIVLMLVAAAAAGALGRTMVGPVRQLVAVTRRIAEGDLTQRATVNGPKELRELATSFNLMADRIGQQHATLEQSVAQRTSELVELNATLERRVEEAVRKNMEQERMLVYQSRLAAMGEMIGNIAHQWRQPLQAVALILGNILDRYALHELSEEALHAEIERAGKVLRTMSKTMDDFRSFFRPDQKPEVFAVAAPVKEALFIMGASLKNNDIEVVERLAPGLGVLGYPHQFAQAVLNLIANAKETLQERNVPMGRIEISLERSGSQAVLAVQDNGGGVSEQVLPRIFDPFFTTRAQGSGIGLYMTKTIVERYHGGKIKAENHGPGARIAISVPLALEGARA